MPGVPSRTPPGSPPELLCIYDTESMNPGAYMVPQPVAAVKSLNPGFEPQTTAGEFPRRPPTRRVGAPLRLRHQQGPAPACSSPAVHPEEISNRCAFSPGACCHHALALPPGFDPQAELHAPSVFSPTRCPEFRHIPAVITDMPSCRFCGLTGSEGPRMLEGNDAAHTEQCSSGKAYRRSVRCSTRLLQGVGD